MNYRSMFRTIFCYFCLFAVDLEPQVVSDQSQKTDQIFDALQLYGRTAGQLATTVIAVMGSRQNAQTKATDRFSSNDKVNIVQTVMTSFLLLVEFARYCHARKLIKQTVQNMTHQDFALQFPHLALVEYQIILMKKLIDLTVEATLPQQIFARIQLTKMSLPYPYEKAAQKASRKMYKACFDRQGNFVWTELSLHKHPYKKFLKKVAQGWQGLVLKSDSFAQQIQPEYCSKVATWIDTPYNNALIGIIHAGMHAEFDQMKLLGQPYADQPVVARLLNYYLPAG